MVNINNLKQLIVQMHKNKRTLINFKQTKLHKIFYLTKNVNYQKKCN